MRSFIPSLSFLLYVFCLQTDLLITFNGQSPNNLALAADVPVNSGHRLPFRGGHRRRAESNGTIEARSDLILYPGRRAAGATFTNFVTGLGACGGFNVASDFVVALDMQQFDVANHCGAQITINAKGKTAQATIVDRCEKCGFNNLDLTDGLYAFFDPTMFGVFEGDWEYGSGPAPPPSPPPKPPAQTPKAPKSTPIQAPPTSTTHSPLPSKTSSTSTPPSSSASKSSTTSKSSTKQNTSGSSTSTTSSALATTTAAADGSNVAGTSSGNIEGIYQAVLGMSAMFLSALGSSD